MKNKSFKYILSVMLSSVLLMVGCGSSSNNPVSSGNVNSGLVKVSGNVKNIDGNSSVSFYTPAAAVKSNLNEAAPLRAALSNDGIYTFYTDENGYYSGTIAAGEYYVMARNSDGSMKSVPTKQRFSASARADEANTETGSKVDEIVLTKVQDIHGSLNTNAIGISCASIPVFIENAPFIAVTNTDGDFVFNSVPVGDYTISANIEAENTRYHFSTSVSSSQLSSTIDLSSYTSESITGSQIKGTVKDSKDNLCKGKMVMAVIESGEIYSVLTDSQGSFTMPFGSDTQNVAWFVDMQSVSMDSSNVIVCNSEAEPEPDSKCTILITEPVDLVDPEDPEESPEYIGSTSLMLYKEVSSGNYELYSSEVVYLPLASYPICNLDKGNYYYIIGSEYPIRGFDEEIEDGFSVIRIAEPFALETELATKTASITVMLQNPFIFVKNSGEYLCFNMTAESNNSSVTIAPFVQAIYEDGTTPIDLSIKRMADEVQTPYIDFSNLKNEASGTYNIIVGYTVSYKDFEETITSDPVPYVKH